MEKLLAKALGQDVTKMATQEKRLLLSRLLARFAHEVRNPLSSLDIHVQLLEEDLNESAPQLREKAAGRFEIIHGELHRLENIVKHFLSLAGPSSLDLEAVDVSTAIGHVCELLRPEATARGIQLQTRMAGLLSPVPADSAQLTQALMNLVINALQAVGSNGVVEIRAGNSEDNDALLIEVCDSGPGVLADQQSAIFEPFFTTKSDGSGLGLWIVQQIITAHGGEVGVSNAPGGGAVFSVHLPLRREATRDG